MHVFPYSEAQVLHNLTKSFSYYVFDLQVSYGSDLDAATMTVSALAAAMPLASLDARRVNIVAALFEAFDAAQRSRAAAILRAVAAAPWRIPFEAPAWMED